jgi:hypothetical protein
MNRPHSLLTYYCQHEACRALLALLPPGALLYDTRLLCPHCGKVTKIVKTVDRQRQRAYTESRAPHEVT